MAPGHQRPVLGPLHQPVDVAVDHHVDGVGPAGGQRAADQGGHHQPDRRQAALRHHHGGQRRDQQQLDDPRLGQGDVGPDVARPPRSPTREGGRLSGHVRSAYDQGLARDQAAGPGTLGPTCRDAAPPPSRPRSSHRLNVLALVLTALIVVTGGAVRLTGSGLGCSDWPTARPAT